MPKTIEIQVRTKADTKEAQDLKNLLENMKDVEVEVKTSDADITKTKQEVESLGDEKPVIDMQIDGNDITLWKKEVDRLDGTSVWVACDFDGTPLKNAEKQIRDIDGKIIDVGVNVEGDKEVDAVDEKIESTNGKSIVIPVATEGEEQVYQIEEITAEINGKTITIPVIVEGEEQLTAIQEMVSNLNGKPVNIPVTTDSSSLDGLTNKIAGVAGGIAMADEATRMWTASTQRQSNEVYLASKMGTEKAREMGNAIQKIVAQVPGDDTFMNTLLTGSLAKQTDLTTAQLKQQANVMADYLSMSQAQGKNALEAQQDLKSYILSGSTAELQRSSILSNQVDTLENQETIYDRIQALQKAMDAEGYSGFSSLETAALKMETIMGGIEKGYADLGSMALPHIEGLLDGILQLDDATGGLFLDLVSGTKMAVASVVTGVSAFGEFHRGVEALKETKIGSWASSAKKAISNLATTAKNAAKTLGTSLFNGIKRAGTAAKTAAIEFGKLGKKVLLAGMNAMKTVAMWIAEAAAKVASTIATTALAIAEWLLASPILLVVLAIVALIAILWYLYNTNEDVRNAIDWFRDSLVNAWNIIVSTVMNAVQSVITFFQNLYQSILSTGQWIWNSILNVLSFIATVPGRVWSYLLNIINRVVSFASNVISRFRTAATNAVSNFINGIAQLPGKVYNELQKTLSRVMDWGSQIVSRLGSIAQQAWQAFVRGLGIGSPGYIQILTLKELLDTGKRIPAVAQGIIGNLAKMAGEAVDAWGTPSFQYGFENITKKDGVNIGNIEGNDNRNIIDLLNQLLDALNNKGDGEPTLIFNLYGDMDNEDRMQKFLEAVRRELNWNNATAGRTIDG